MRKYIMPVIGVASFVVGGLYARQKSFEIAETLEKTFTKKTPPQPAE